ncbi:hypothetical protein PFISCL1PPCAC_3777, partial [Pristionchus fissidentatus]
CQSSYCTVREMRTYNEFFDLTKAPYTEADRTCPESEESYSFSIDIQHTSPMMNSCIHIRYLIKYLSLKKKCIQPLCNQNKAIYNLTKRGKGVCYLKTKEIETTTCWGDYCFWGRENNRGCIDATGPSDDFVLRLGESALDNEYLHICKGNYCNSDFQYPNGTIVGPSASRPHTSSLFPALPITSTLLL